MENNGIVLNAYVKTMPSFISYDEDNVNNLTDESSEIAAPSTDFVLADRETKVCVPDNVLELHKHRLENKDSLDRDRKTTAVDILRRNFGRSRSRRNVSVAEDYGDSEDVVFTISNMQMGRSGKNEEQSDHHEVVEIKLEYETESEFSEAQEVERRPSDVGETFECQVNSNEFVDVHGLEHHVYCSVYCIANEINTNSEDNAGEEGNRNVIPSTSSNTSQELHALPQQSDSEHSGYPEPFTLSDLVDATTLNNVDSNYSVVLTCRICLEDNYTNPLHCCQKAVCGECLKTYVSSQVRVGRAAIACPITECSGFLEEGTVLAHLPAEDVGKYKYFLELSRLDAGTKPCPQCSLFTSLKGRSSNLSKRSGGGAGDGAGNGSSGGGGGGGDDGDSRNGGGGGGVSGDGGGGDGDVSSNGGGSGGGGGGEEPSTAVAAPNRTEHKYKIQCSKCQFVWCFKCHAPWHEGLKCRDYRKGDKLLRDWASVIEHGQRNAQKCPRCKIHIQRTEGCDHMTCTQCNTNFCYRCGERYRHMRFFGDHMSNLSVFGCKYRYLPNKPHLRRLVRGSVCVTKLLLCPLVIVLTVVVGAVVIVAALLVFPFYFCKQRRKRPQGTEYWFS